MINGRPINPILKALLIALLGFVIVSQLIRYALLPFVIALVAWGAYRIYLSERGAFPRASKPRRPPRVGRTVRAVRIDPKKDLTVPKDWR